MPSSFNAYDSTKPVSGDLGTALPAEVLNNCNSIWQGIIAGVGTGSWTRAAVNGSGSAEEPQYLVWSNGVYRVRGTFTYASGYVTSVLWEFSSDSGTTPNSTGTWATMWTQTASYDGSNNMTSGNNQSFAAWLYEWIGKFKALRTLYNAHVAATGTAVHGLGTMSTQGAAAVAITGGAIDGTAIGGTTTAAASLKTIKESTVNLGATITVSTPIDWSAGDWFYGTITGSGGKFTFTNLPNGPVQTIRLEVTNALLATSPWPAGTKWQNGGAPTTTSGIDIYEFSCRDGATVRGVQITKNSS